MECFKYIFLHLVCNGQQTDLNIASRFLKVLQTCVHVYVYASVRMCIAFDYQLYKYNQSILVELRYCKCFEYRKGKLICNIV